MRHPSEYVARAIGGLRGYLRGGMMPASSVSVFRKVGASKAKVSATLTDCIVTHDPSDAVVGADIANAECVINLLVMRDRDGGWPFAEPPAIGDVLEVNGERFTVQRVDHWVLGWKLKATKNVEAPTA